MKFVVPGCWGYFLVSSVSKYGQNEVLLAWQLVEVINENYNEFVGLGSQLSSVEGAVMRIRKPIQELKVWHGSTHILTFGPNLHDPFSNAHELLLLHELCSSGDISGVGDIVICFHMHFLGLKGVFIFYRAG